MRTIKLAVIPGDGIGKEIVPEGLKVLRAALRGSDTHLEEIPFDLGAQRWHRTGETLTDEDLAAIRECDAILLGAVGDPSVPAGILERGLLLKLRFSLDHYVNLRPSVYYPGVPSPLKEPGDIDFVVVREGTEGLYIGNGGALRVGTPQEIANEVSVNTAFGVERVVRYAFEQAAARRGKLTLVHKRNVLVHAGDLWMRTVERIGSEYPQVVTDYCHIDAATSYMVTDGNHRLRCAPALAHGVRGGGCAGAGRDPRGYGGARRGRGQRAAVGAFNRAGGRGNLCASGDSSLRRQFPLV